MWHLMAVGPKGPPLGTYCHGTLQPDGNLGLALPCKGQLARLYSYLHDTGICRTWAAQYSCRTRPRGTWHSGSSATVGRLLGCGVLRELCSLQPALYGAACRACEKQQHKLTVPA